MVLIQDYTRTGFDPRIHPLSLLIQGAWGWIQIINFIAAGLLNVAYAAGQRRVLHPGPGRACGPWLIGVYGAGLVAAGVFVTDPASGYPPGIPEPPGSSWHSTLHGLFAFVVFGSLTAACFVFARRFAAHSQPGWAVYSATTGVAVLALFLAAPLNEDLFSRLLRIAVLLGWAWASALAARLLTSTDTPQPGTSPRSSPRHIPCP